MSIPLPDAERLRALRRMKALAGGLLVLAAAVFVLCRTVGDGRGGWGYLQAAAEASMIGGLADWFAVTALFKRPLRLPIPHTAIIPRKKDQIGDGLARFVHDYFLTPEVVGDRVAAARVPQRLGGWLAEPAHAEQVSAELGSAIGGLTSVLRDDELRTAVAAMADRRLRAVQVAPLLARLIDVICDSGQHQQAVTALLRGLMHFLESNRAVFRSRLADESPEWVPAWVDDRVFTRGFAAVQSFLADVSVDESHALRATFDAQLRAYAERLRTDPAEAARVERAKEQLLDHPAIRAYLATLWGNVKRLLVAGSTDPDSELRRTITALTGRAGEVLRDDPVVGARLDEALQRIVAHVMSNYADDVAGVISSTVARWDADETSRRLELQVGRDLQFIRLNGTVVGALAGVVIYALSRLL